MKPFFPLIFLLAVYAQPVPAAGLGLIPDHHIKAELDPVARTLEVEDVVRLGGEGKTLFILAPAFIIEALTVDGGRARYERDGERILIDLGSRGRHAVKFRYRGDISAEPEGTFIAGGSGWRPSTKAAAFTYRITITTPDRQKAVAGGRLMEETEGDGFYRASFQSPVPVSNHYGIDILAGPWRVGERRAGNILLRTYFNPEIASLSADYLDSAAGYIKRYEAIIGPYPYPAFYMVSGPLQVGLGLAGMTYMGTRVFKLPFIRATSLGHEVLHNWWGNGVAVRSGSGNWAEGLTTFMADYALDVERRKDGGRARRLEWLRDYAALPPARARALASFAAKGMDADRVIGYNKAAFVFHMLKREVGDRAFNKAIRDFWSARKFKAAGWADIERAFETASGGNLKLFFRQWLDRPGAPRLALGPVRLSERGGDYTVTLTLKQYGPVYRLTVPLRIRTEKGVRRFQVRMTDRRGRWTVITRSRPLEISVDPDFDVFRRLSSREAPPIMRDVTLKGTTNVVVLAMNASAEALARRMMDTAPRFIDAAGPPPDGPLFIIGDGETVAGYLERNGMAQEGLVPDAVKGPATARVWTGRRPEKDGGAPYLVVEAENEAALKALLGPLPHYRRQSYLVFNGSRAIRKGVWPPPSRSPLERRLDR